MSNTRLLNSDEQDRCMEKWIAEGIGFYNGGAKRLGMIFAKEQDKKSIEETLTFCTGWYSKQLCPDCGCEPLGIRQAGKEAELCSKSR